MMGQVPVTVVTPLLIEDVATHCGTPLFQASTCPPVPVPKRDAVAKEVTFAVVPVLLPRMNPALICGSWASVRALSAMPRVTFVPPICEPRVPEVTDMPVPTERDDVATEENAVVPFP